MQITLSAVLDPPPALASAPIYVARAGFFAFIALGSPLHHSTRIASGKDCHV